MDRNVLYSSEVNAVLQAQQLASSSSPHSNEPVRDHEILCLIVNPYVMIIHESLPQKNRQ